MAQEKKTIRGVVRDETGEGLIGATVVEKGTTNATLTGEDGRFSMKVPPNATLVVSFIGYKSKSLTASGDDLTILLEPSAGDLQEVVVTSFGITRQQKALGYAVSTVKGEDLTKTASPNFATALYGKAPGVRIGATPGGATSAANITVRGINSITGKSQPLIVLDGVPIRDGEVKNNDYWGDQRLRGNGLLDLNPEDIESISVLKGAPAAALYGSEAVNGVLLVTTKKAKGFSVDFNANYNFDQVAFLPRYQNVRGPGAPIHVSNGGQDAEGFVYFDLDGDGTNETRGLPNFTINFGAPFDGKPTLAWDGRVIPYEAQKDNYKGLFRTANNSAATVAVSQASDNSNVRLSLTRQDNQGVSLGADNSKNIANLNSSLRLGNKVNVDLLVNFINQRTKNRPYSVDRMINNFTGMIGRFDNADWYLDNYKTSKGYRYRTGTEQSLTPDENIIHPGFRGDIGEYIWRVKEHNEEELSNRVIASLTNNWQIVRDLKLRARLATDFTSMKTESRQSTEIPLAFGNSGFFKISNYENAILYGDVLLTYNRKLSSDLELNVMGGYTATKETGSTVARETNGGLSVENWFDVAASVNTPGGSATRYSVVRDAFIGTANLSFKEYLFLEATLRSDRTSTMHPSENSFLYPSVNGSFVFSDAWKMPAFISYGKVRGSWGMVGNYPDRYQANIAYTQNTLGVQKSGGQPVIYTTIPSSFGNDGIRAEVKKEYEFGLEMSFVNNRIGLDVSYYNARIVDQILPLTIPSSSGATSVLTNIGTLRNRGIEVGLKGAPVKSKDMRWDVNLNFALNRNTVEKLATGSDELLHADYDGNAAQLISKVGQPMGDFYAHPIARDDNGNPIVDPDGLYKLDEKMVKVGNAMPKVVGGFINTFTYKSLALEVVLDYRLGGYVMPTGINWMISRGLLEESLNYMDKAHGGLSYYRDAGGKGILTDQPKGPNGEQVFNDGMLMEGVTNDGQTNTNVISQAYYYWNTYNWGGPQYSKSRYELYIQKNSYVKMRELSLSYNFPTAIAGKIGAKRLQLSVFGRNLFYLYRTLKDLDAEQTTAGSRWHQTLTNAGTNPSTRTMGVMVRANF
ncbi:SusC/RagA family TonB-linked outer membrane protein [Chitinophaga cymbidii]|uniref:SusC/RagA family TonB-linked outer membrane protein n=2 Tax=Chitinophaga cymbidii TaxID=1096750 RepID=A0A512RL82_9BACT|nr:SusC/RagA family TonB-linked outer membrane protein [Chitinophaga cymbidii]